MEFVDRDLTCLDCGQPFVFTAGEQEFYDRKGFREEPKRCKPCRDTRKSRRNGQLTDGLDRGGQQNGNGHARGRALDDDDNIGNRLAPARGQREARPAPGRGRSEREMFDAVCAQCGTATRVPFRPVAGRPVYCRDCFGARRGVGG
jgi:CxxC-x17-CxxC domain-containing protein